MFTTPTGRASKLAKRGLSVVRVGRRRTMKDINEEVEGPAPEVAAEPAVTEPAVTEPAAEAEVATENEAEAPEAAAAEDKPAEEAGAEG
jgi:hypothetical protein